MQEREQPRESGRDRATRAMTEPNEWHTNETRAHDCKMCSECIKSLISLARLAPSCSKEACAVCSSLTEEQRNRSESFSG